MAMWVFFSIAVGGSLVTYLSAGDYSLLDNIQNTTDLVFVVTVTVFVFIFGDRSTRFNKFDLGCLIAVLVIVVFWLIFQNHVVSNLSIQVILIIAYFPVISRIWKSNENTESFVVWIGLFLAPCISLLSSKGVLATIYALRAIISISVLLVLMVRAELKQRNDKVGKPALLSHEEP
jgi:RsiW-degrading membrane proteinase PrsW (M82 family)